MKIFFISSNYRKRPKVAKIDKTGSLSEIKTGKGFLNYNRVF